MFWKNSSGMGETIGRVGWALFVGILGPRSTVVLHDSDRLGARPF